MGSDRRFCQVAENRVSSFAVSRKSQRGGDKPQIVVRGLTKMFGSVAAVKNIELVAYEGEIVVVLGGSGAGKTTLLKLLIGLNKPTSGAIFIGDVDIVPLGEIRLNAVRQKLGMVFQYAALLDSLDVLDNVAFPLREHSKLSEKEIRARVSGQLEALGLKGVEGRYPSELSGGMRKRVGLARALMMDPQILLYDEPTSGLDPLTSRQVDDLIVETRDRCNVTSIVISHDMASAMAIADYVYVLSEGTVAGEGTPRELLEGKSALAKTFLESSGISTEALLRGLERADAPQS